MEDARRFLRYGLPGLAFVIQTAVLLLLLRPDLFPRALGPFSDKSTLAAVVAGLVASGGLGYLFSTVHHSIHWRTKWLTIDHRANLLRLANEGLITLPTTPDMVTPDDAWVYTSILWYQRREDSPAIRGADANARALTDLAHMLGTTRIASVAATLAAFGYAAGVSSWAPEGSPVVRFLCAATVAIVFGAAACKGYLRTARFAQRFIDGVLTDALRQSANEDDASVVHAGNLPLVTPVASAAVGEKTPVRIPPV
jgi:hypothetical protein